VDPSDREWQARLEQHRQRRPASWDLWEVPHQLPEAIHTATQNDCLLIDSVGTWLANFLEVDDRTWATHCHALSHSLKNTPARVILVSEETGWGVVPAYPLGRQFRDRLGQLSRQLIAQGDRADLVIGGRVLNLTQLGQPIPQAYPQETPMNCSGGLHHPQQL
jgi:adenosylcobinamide kinase/adenosylcobinamide-phosphate guanylyltransferase